MARQWFILRRMRTTRAWLHIVAIVALMVGALPVSALAELCQPTSCVKKCCTAKALEPVPAQSCHSGNAQSKGANSLGATSEKPGGCKCTITSKTSDQPEKTLPATLSYKVPDVAAAVLTISPEFSVPVKALVQPGIFASDSGPPNSVSSLPWLGRAPPVRPA